MNIFNKPIRSEQQDEHNFMNIGELQVRSGWLKDHPQYHSMVFTCIHMANLLAGIEFLQQDTNDKNLFKMAEMNKQVNEIVQGRKLYEPKVLDIPVGEQQDGQWDLIVQKVSGLFNTCYVRICHLKGFRMEIESQKKREPAVEDLRGYDMKIQFKANESVEPTKTAKPTKEEEMKSHFRWVEGYPVRIFLTAEKRRPYAIYLLKVTKAKELLDYFEMKKSSSGFARHRQAIYRYALNFKRNVIAAFAEQIESNANRTFRNPREVFVEEANVGNESPISPHGQGKSPRHQKESSSFSEISSPRKLLRGSSIKFKVQKNELREQDYNGADEPISVLVRRRQISYVDPADAIRNSPIRKLTMMPEVVPEEFKLDGQHPKQSERGSEQGSFIKLIGSRQSNNNNNASVVHEVEFEEENAQIITQREQQAKEAGSTRLDIRLQLKELTMYVKHFQSSLKLELVQCMPSRIETSKQSMVLYPIISYEVELVQSKNNPQLFTPRDNHEFRFSSQAQDFRCIFKLPNGPVETFFQLETNTKYQKWSYRPIHIKSVPLAGRLGMMFSRAEMKPYSTYDTVEFVRQFLLKADYDIKYLFIQQGRERLQADEVFKERVWEMLLNQNSSDNEQLMEKQVFLGVPERFRQQFFRLLTENKEVPLHSLTTLQFHEIKLVKRSLPEDLVEQIQEHLIVEDLIERLLKLNCNRMLRDRMHGVLMYHRYKFGQCKNVLYVFLYEMFKKLGKVIMENCKSRQQILRLFDLYYEVEHQLDELFGEIYNYL